jgi:putative Mg2+ transporter-C (MgtC) family protein
MEVYAIGPLDLLARFCIAFLAGALIGMERERHSRPAGLRTHMLVSLAAALFAMISIVAAGDRFDPGRIAAQVVTGIGFLGAGTIMRYGANIKGLTTAASLWTAAALGLASGFGWFMAASVGAVFAFLALTGVKAFEDRLPHADRMLYVDVTAAPGASPLPLILTTLSSLGAVLDRVCITGHDPEVSTRYALSIIPTSVADRDVLVHALAGLEGVEAVDPQP